MSEDKKYDRSLLWFSILTVVVIVILVLVITKVLNG
ncbi:MAG: hypothetical protein CFH33_01312 [Alphaproteobacteria bacterium MarineAlpha9_Bin3]|nr:MAG: hypothetical protein CFH33_01312 [Alphaproteobacteria bacterium MarineAlpha9_Bin3]